jgi:monoamine oxidase
MRRTFHSRAADVLREAKEANQESALTGIPLDEVSEMRAERRAVERAASRERLESYNSAVQRVIERGAPEDHVDKWVAMRNLRMRRSVTVDKALEGREVEDRIARWFTSQDNRVTRRTLLKGAGVVAAAALLDSRPQSAAAAGGGPTIAIIGGGLAGLRCAQILAGTRSDQNFNLYEANATFGGRCATNRTFFLNGQVAEMHGEEISTEHKSMLNLVSLFNLTLEDANLANANGRVATYWVNGARYTQAQVDADWQATYYQLFHNATLAAPFPQSYNNNTPQGVTWDNQDCVTWMNQNLPGGTSTKFGAVCLQAIRGSFGDPSSSSALDVIWTLGYNSSVKGNGFQNNVSPNFSGTDDRWHVIGGNDQIVTGLLNQIPSNKLHLNVALVQIDNNGSTNGPYTLTLQPQPSGSSFTVIVQSLVLTNPFASMRNKVDLTKAGFTKLKMNAINNLSMGNDGKIFMQFNGHPWQPAGYTGEVLEDNGPPFLSWCWEIPNNNYAGATCIWNGYPSGNYTPQILSTYGITQHEEVTPTQLVTDALRQVEPIFPGITAAYNGLSWCHFGSNDPWVQGSYSFYGVGQQTVFGNYEGVQEGFVHFGGEHTSYNFQGFMEGAVVSGERVAHEIGPRG